MSRKEPTLVPSNVPDKPSPSPAPAAARQRGSMTRTEMLLTIVAEECAEVIQVASLAQDLGLRTIDVESTESEREDKRMPTDYRSRIALEIEDLCAATEMLQGGTVAAGLGTEEESIPKFSLILSPNHCSSSVISIPEELGKLIRASACLAQTCSKALRFGLTRCENPEAMESRRRYHNRDRIALEVTDILGIVEKLKKHSALPVFKHWRELRDQKKERVENFFVLSKEIGTLTEL